MTNPEAQRRFVPLGDKARRLRAQLAALGGRNAILYTLTSILSRAAVLILAPVYTRKLDPSQYGDLALAQTLVSTLPTFVSLGLLSALSRFFFEGKDASEGIKRAGEVARWVVVLAMVSAVALQLSLFIVPLPTTGLFQFHELSCVVWGATGALILGVPLAALRSAQRGGAASLLQLTEFVVSLSSAIVLVALMDRGVRGALEATGIAGATSTAIGLIFVLKTMPGGLDTRTLRRALVFSLPYVPHFAANQLLLISDRWLLKSFGLSQELGVYSLASQIAAPVMLVVTAWNEAASPRVGEDFRLNGIEGLKKSEGNVVRSYLFLSIGVSVGLLAFSPLILVVFGPAYSGALWLLPALCLVMTIESVYYPYSNFLFYTNQTKVIPRITVVAGLANILSNLVLIPLLGVPGAIVSRAFGGGIRSLASARIARATVTRPSRH